MKNWNRTGKIKAIFLGILCLPNIIISNGVNPQIGILAPILVPLIFGSFTLPILSKINSIIFGQEITKPNWNDNPFNLNRPLIFFQFGAFFFITNGITMIIGSLLNSQLLNNFGLSLISFGIGILVGIRLTLKWKNK